MPKIFIKFEPEHGAMTRKMVIQDALRPLGEIEIVSSKLFLEGDEYGYNYPSNDSLFIQADRLEVKYYMVPKDLR